VNQTASNGVQYTVTQLLFVTPNQVTLHVGDTRSMQLIDENGVLINNSVWTFDDTSIAEIIPPQNPGDLTLLQADAVGATDFIATVGDRTGIAKITVLAAGAPFPVGTVQWAVPPLGSYGIAKTVQSLRIDENTPDLYIEDDGAYGGNGSIRALTSDGQQKWIWPSTSQDWFPLLVAADDQGGAVYFSGQDTPGPYFSYCYFGRVDQTGTETWQYQESNCREDYAIAPDGTIFLMEDAYQNNNVAVVTALDPITGQVKFNITLPASSQYTSGGGATEGLDPDRPGGLAYCTPGTPGGTFTQTMAIHGSISASSDGNVYIPFTTSTAYGDASGCDPSPDPSYPKYPHLVQPGDGNWSASATLQLMTIHPDGSYATQQLDANSASGTGMTIGSATGFFTLGRAIPDGQGGTLLTVWSPSMLYHASSGGVSKFGLPIFPEEPFGDDLYAADSMLLGEDGTAYIVGSSSEQSPVDTIAAIDITSGAVKWTTSVHGPQLSTVTSDGSVAFEYSPDSSVHSALASPTGQVSPLFANPADNSDAGPIISATHGLHLPSELTLGTWLAYQPDMSASAIKGSFKPLANSERPESHGDAAAQNKPSLCHTVHCALAPVNDTIITNPPASAERDVKYGVYSANNGVLSPLYQQSRPYEISLIELDNSGPARKCVNGCTNRIDDPSGYSQGFFSDDLSAQFGGTSVATQTYFVDRGQVRVFWPKGDFDSQGFPITVWYGAWTQTATVSPSDPRGATFQQNDPDLQHKFTCQTGPAGQLGCDTTGP
jgi:hypothetical protein